MANICKNCVYWLKLTTQIRNNQKSLCFLSQEKNSALFSPCGLYTTETFGCNQFIEQLPKKRKDARSKE